jgi:hypothetical protein
MHRQKKKLAAVILIAAISTPAFGAGRDERPGIYDRFAKFVVKILRSITNGDGMIGPIP